MSHAGPCYRLRGAANGALVKSACSCGLNVKLELHGSAGLSTTPAGSVLEWFSGWGLVVGDLASAASGGSLNRAGPVGLAAVGVVESAICATEISRSPMERFVKQLGPVSARGAAGGSEPEPA